MGSLIVKSVDYYTLTLYSQASVPKTKQRSSKQIFKNSSLKIEKKVKACSLAHSYMSFRLGALFCSRNGP